MKKFILESAKWLSPICAVLFLFYVLTPQMFDYNYHLTNTQTRGYPPFVVWSMHFIGLLVGRDIGIFLLNLTMAVILPYLLIVLIFKESKHREFAEKAGIIYLYGSGIPLALFFYWVIPQATIQVLVLLSILDPAFLFLFFLTGPYIHYEWAPAFIATAAFVAFQKYKHRIPKGVWHD